MSLIETPAVTTPATAAITLKFTIFLLPFASRTAEAARASSQTATTQAVLREIRLSSFSFTLCDVSGSGVSA